MGIRSITFFGENGIPVYKGKLISLPFKDDVIIRKSIEFFNDDEPCIIHKSFVVRTIVLNIEDYFNRMEQIGVCEMEWDELPDEIKSILEFKKAIKKICWKAS